MIKPLLIEIGVEELPAVPFLKELPNIEKIWTDILEQNKLLCGFNFYYTPRRFVFWHREFPISQEDSTQEFFGAPVAIAYKDGIATPAANGFAKKCGVELEELQTITKNGNEVLYYKKEIKGQDSKDLLEDMVNQFISKLNFGKSMRWASRSDSFIRPIRNLSIVLGDQLVQAELFGVQSKKSAFAHRMVSYEPFEFDFAGDYFCKLDKNGVILYQDERRSIILDQMKKIENQHDIKIDIDEDLLDEIVAITEYPTALLGSFDEEFLTLPQEVIVNSMKEHQRYFAVFKDGKIQNKFIVVSNAKTDDFSLIVSGNEKVLRPRLADAMFFYKNDLKNGLSNEGLKNILFLKGLGTVYDKSLREAKIAQYLADIYNIQDKELLEKTVMLSKADLMSEMVYEFTELQGLMGYYYAKAAGEDEKLYTAIKEQYLPDGENSEVPSSTFSSIVALSAKLDSLFALFSVGKIPTGSKDPFALRRAAAGIVRISRENNLPLNFEKIMNDLSYLYDNLDQNKVMEFFTERLYQIFNINSSVVKAVLNSGEKDILELSKKLDALAPIVQSSQYKDMSSTFKRVANIIKDIDINNHLSVDENLFEQDEEKELYKAYKDVVNKDYPSYDEQLDALFALKPKLDAFFDNVFVNHEDEKIKTNRKNLIGLIYQAFRQIADIKEITI
jgi:glycyl-tRNA synthetase beta chain